jgi:YYY domain-containing protein
VTSFRSWYILITLLGWMTLPLTYRLLPALADRGYTLARTFGLMLWGYIFWLFASLGMAQNDTGGLLLGLVIVGGLSAWNFINRKSEIVNWLGENLKLVIVTELLFLVAFGFMAFFRSANPEILGTEKPMELMFINGIMNSPAFPPRDLWLSGYSISYYYFGFVMTAMLAMFTGVPATMAFNLMLSLIFGLSAAGAYGVLYNLLSIRKPTDQVAEKGSRFTFHALLAPLFLLLISNAEGFLEVLHARGLFWKDGANFWTWLDIPELRDVPPQVAQWTADRYWWWWRASRVIMDYDFQNNWTGDVINEFPAFSFILGDLHPHVLAIPFFLLAIAVALNLFLGGFRGRVDLYVGQLHISKTGFFLSAFMLGGAAFLNTWDILPVAAVIVFSYALARVRRQVSEGDESGWGWERLEDILLFGIPALITAYLLYLPFFISFDSQLGGILPSFMYITRGAQLWVMWGVLFIPIFALLIYFARSKMTADWKKGVGITVGFVLLLLGLMMVVGFAAYKLRPELIQSILDGQQMDVNAFLSASFARRLSYIGSLLTLLALLIPSLSFLVANRKSSNEESTFNLQPSTFILLLIALGTLLILGPDFLYLRDNFGYRINTIFKFYYQAWILLSLASAYGTAVLLKNLRGFANGIFSVLFVLILIVGLTYPALGFPNKVNGFKPPFGFTLDDFDRVQRENPDEAAAILWLRSAPDGVIAEATGNPYSNVGRISIYTGLPTILGWGNHEGQWHGSDFQGLLAQRKDDIETLYVTPDWQTAQFIIEQYNVRYIVVGNLERTSYRVNEEKFNNFLKPVFQQGNVTIYEVP